MKHDEASGVENAGCRREMSDQLGAGVAALGIAPLSDDQIAIMITYLEALIAKNLTINLTRIVDPSDGVRLHLLDSLAALPELLASPDGAVLDLGSGGGLPGVPLAIATGRSVKLLDSVAKKARAVQEILDAVGGGITAVTISARAEELALRESQAYAVVVARAVAPLPSLVELASPLLGRGGRLIALKGRPAAEELASGIGAAKLSGMRQVSERAYSLPGSGESRTIVVYEKTSEPKIKLPRRSGLAQHSPLA